MADKFLGFAALVSMVVWAAGSRPPEGVAPLPLRGLAGGGNDDKNERVYTLDVETGLTHPLRWEETPSLLREQAGTDVAIGVELAAVDGSGFAVTDLARWGGLMGAGHDYYERGNVDVFSGRAPCLPSPPCRMNLTSDGAGAHHGWYCKSVEVTATGPHAGCARAAFGVEQWLATDEPALRRAERLRQGPHRRRGGALTAAGSGRVLSIDLVWFFFFPSVDCDAVCLLHLSFAKQGEVKIEC
uniref:PLAT domain-containing protein n=1 Tax=Oryza brachyantha TaxID=4533 RepID=J3LYH7_ORYBR